MENDYLWDKTGEEKDIERLENALQAFRYQPTNAPQLPVKILQIEEKPKFNLFPKIFRFALTGIAGLLVTFISLGIWMQTSNRQIEDIEEIGTVLVKPIDVEIDELTEIKSIKSPLIVKKAVHTQKSKIEKPINIAYRPKVNKIEKNRVIQLTEEEKEAYRQLMLALSITGSKLKEVKDKANGVDGEVSTVKSLK